LNNIIVEHIINTHKKLASHVEDEADKI